MELLDLALQCGPRPHRELAVRVCPARSMKGAADPQGGRAGPVAAAPQTCGSVHGRVIAANRLANLLGPTGW